jgi:peptide/nickel transport system substrate-binding protein
MLGVGSAVALAGCGSSENNGDDGGDDGGMGDDDGGDDGIDQDENVDEFPDRADSYDTNTAAEFTTLNPLYNTEDGAGTAIGRALELGYTFDANNELFPLHYDMSTENGEVWVFELRDNLQFSDPYGQVTASDYVYMIQELHQSDWANTANTSEWTGINVEETGNLEFQAELQNPQVLWPETFAPLEYPIPQDLVQPYVEEEDVEGIQQDEELLELQFTGNLGPYVLDSWDRGSGTNYSRNENYYLQEADDAPDLFQEAPYFDGASISVVPEQSSRLAQLETGEVDAAGIPPERYQEFVDKPGVNVRSIPQPYNEIVSLNMRDNGWSAGPGNLFRYKEFRQAMTVSIDKQELIAGVLRGLGEPHFTWQPQWSPFYPEGDDVRKFGVDPNLGSEQARSLAEEAFSRSEYDYQFDGEDLVTPEGDQVTLNIYHSQGQETEQLIAEFVRDSLGENLGIEVQVEAIQGTRFNNEYWTAEPAEAGISDDVWGREVTWEQPSATNPGPWSVTSNESWDMSMVFGLNTYPRNPLTNQFFFDEANCFYNPVGYYPEFDPKPLFEDARQAESREEIRTAFQDLFVKISEEQPYIMMAFTDDTIGYNPDLNGPIENFSNGWDFPTWHIQS